jgi:hypothetical protein
MSPDWHFEDRSTGFGKAAFPLRKVLIKIDKIARLLFPSSGRNFLFAIFQFLGNF